jgi:hypothetical protein
MHVWSLLLLLLLLLLTAIGLSPGGSSPTLVQTKIKIHKTTITTKKLQNIRQQNNYTTIKISTQTEHIAEYPNIEALYGIIILSDVYSLLSVG